MNSVLFQNHEGTPIASLVMSAPVAPERTCVFINMCFTVDLFQSRESEILLPGRPTEYFCRYDQAGDGFTIAFENQNGWRIGQSRRRGRRPMVGQKEWRAHRRLRAGTDGR